MACAAELAYLPHPCSVHSRTDAPDGAGGSTSTWTVGAVTRCHIARQSKPLATEVADRLQGRTAYIMRLPAGTVVPLAVRISAAGRTYVTVSDPSDVPGSPTISVVVAEVSP